MKRSPRNRSQPRHLQRRDRRRGAALFWGLVSAILAGSASLAVATWGINLGAGSSGQAQSVNPGSITIVASASPTPTNLLYPGGTGDVVVNITNNNAYEVGLSQVTLPVNTTYATGYSNSSLTTTVAACSSTTSLVTWTGSGGSTTTVTLGTALVLPASGSITVTFTGGATMGATSPTACENTYFSMPSLSGITAQITTGTATASGGTDTL